MAHNHADHNHPHSHDRITAAGTKVSESGIECCAHHEIEM
jgi:hypothetical protein